jgi:hypothetical protein
MPTAPLIRFQALVMDRFGAPYQIEHFLDVADRAQARCLARLVKQEELVFDFYGSDYAYAYSQQVYHSAEMRALLQRIAAQAVDYYGDVPASHRDFARARALFQQRAMG